MGVFTDVLGELSKGLRSSEGELLKSEGGKLIHDAFKEMMPDLQKTAQGIHDTHVQWFNQGRITSPPDPNKALEMAKTLVEPRYLGRSKQILTQGAELANKQRGPIHAKNVADIASIVLRETGTQAWRAKAGTTVDSIKSASPYTSSSELERDVKKFMGLTMLGRVAIPHTMQSVNTLLNEGATAYAKAAYDMATDYQGAKKYATTVGALFDETLQEHRAQLAGKPTWISKLFYMPGFSTVRKGGIIHAAIAGKYAAIDAAEDFVKTGSKTSELALKFHGLVPADVLKQGGILNQDQIDKAAYNSVNESFFLRDMKTPWIWQQNPTNRLLFLYKNFQFREGKMLQNAIVRGFRGGPVSFVKTLGILTTTFPIAGEVIGDLSSIATGHGLDRDKSIKHWTGNPIADRLIDDYAHVAGLGIWYSIARSTGYKQLLQWAAGPVFGSLDEVAEGLIGAAHGKTKAIERTVLRRVPVIGSALTNALLPSEQMGKHTHSHTHRHKNAVTSNN